MTEQITIKLNKKKFEPILTFLREYTKGMYRTNSEIAGKALFFNYLYFTQKIEGNKTRWNVVADHKKKFVKNHNFDLDLIEFEKIYSEFQKNGLH